MKRKYEQKERARRQAQTRQRIVEAAVDLHTSVGPARTTISGIAERAGIERHTVYAHFPDDATLFRACSEHWAARHPLPDLERLRQVEDPVRRFREALGAMYAWYESVEADLALFFRDASIVPANADALAEMAAVFAGLADAVSRGWPRRKSVRAAIGHAFEFETWRSLVRRQGLSRTQAVDAMARLVSERLAGEALARRGDARERDVGQRAARVDLEQVTHVRLRRGDAAPGDPLALLAAVVDLVPVHLQDPVEGALQVALHPLRQALDLEREPVGGVLVLEGDDELAARELPALVPVAEREPGRQVGRVSRLRLDPLERERRHLRPRRGDGRAGEQRRAESTNDDRNESPHALIVPAADEDAMARVCGFCSGCCGY